MRYLLAFAIFAGLAYGQAMVEYGLGVGRSGVSGATAGKGTSKAIGAVFDKTTKSLEAAGKPGAASAPAASAAAPAKPAESEKPAPAASPAIDPGTIAAGIERQELLAKLGKPSMKITNTEGSDIIEKLWYRSPGRETVLVTLRNGKVAAVSPQ